MKRREVITLLGGDLRAILKFLPTRRPSSDMDARLDLGRTRHIDQDAFYLSHRLWDDVMRLINFYDMKIAAGSPL